MQQRTLDGLKVIITRPEDQGVKTAGAVAAAGGRPVVLPMIRILPAEDLAACDAALHHLTDHHGVVFASANAVHAFFARAKTRGVEPGVWGAIDAYAVGSRTADALMEYGIAARAVPVPFTGAALGQLLGSMNIRGKRFLLPRGDRGRDEIADALVTAGALPVSVVVYRTAGPDAATAAAMQGEMRSDGKKALLFASPSAVEEFCRIFSAEECVRVLRSCVIVVIGPTTGAAAARYGMHVDVGAGTPADAGLIEALAAHVYASAGV
jgi:uroporphyrinogen-III synthase